VTEKKKKGESKKGKMELKKGEVRSGINIIAIKR
jgi:hypothetical protein